MRMMKMPLSLRALAARAASLVMALVLSACAGFVPQVGPDPEPLSASRYVTLTTPIIAVGDTQEHLPTGYPLHDNDSAVDAYVEVTQRPPEQPLFGRRVVEWALQQHPDEPFIHLGDVLDLSCRIEAKRVAAVFAATQNAGAILPGNHDGLMFGIYGYNVLEATFDPDAEKWHRACRRGAEPLDDGHKTVKEALTKRDFIAGYIGAQAHGRRAKPGLERPPAQGDVRVSWRSPDPQAYLSAIEARLRDGKDYADSFLAQRLQLPRAPGATRDVILIGLDTNQAGALVGTWDTIMGRSPGSVGHIHPDQVQAVSGWVDEAVIQGDIVVFAGHHHWQGLGLPSRILLRDLMGRLNHPLVYLSAHTHSGFWAVHRALARQPLLEMNVSSLSDWPIAYRRISFAYDEQARRLLVRAELRPQGERPSESYADLLAAWEEEACAPTGLSPEQIRQQDREVVRQQRESRGTLMEWLLSAAGPVCETCEQPLYEHAQAYQDAMLHALLQASANVPADSPQRDVKLPAWCGSQGFEACAEALMAEKATDFPGHVNLFRRKAGLVATVNDHLDRIDDPVSKAYMTCRAVQAAKIDFDATDDDRNNNRSEAKRRAEQFFRIEASVGME
jgi:hypothetical protein